MNINSNLPLIAEYINHGFAPIPIQFRRKKPSTPGWNELRITTSNIGEHFNGTPSNIGILTGEASGGLIDIDIDEIDALRFAPLFLPPTNCLFGRKSKPQSHWVYRAPNAGKRVAFEANGMIVEVRGNNHCTVFPGSVHSSGEQIEFNNPHDFWPSSSSWEVLTQAARKIAIATMLYKAWSSGIRHDLTLAVTAALARHEWSADDVKVLISAVATESDDDELDDRLTGVETTFRAYAQRRPISGTETLSDLLGEQSAEKFERWAARDGSRSKRSSPITQSAPLAALFDISHDAGAADAFASTFKGQLIYCDEQWFQRRNQLFEPAPCEIVQGLAKDFFQIRVRELSPGPIPFPAAKACLTRSRINAALELSRSTLRADPELVDRDVGLVGCADGRVLNLSTGKEAQNSQAIVTKHLGTGLVSNAACPTWTTFLNTIFKNDAEIVSFVQRAVGYSLTGSVSEQCLFILIGNGANGKSTFLKVLHHLFGDYAASVPMHTLMEQKHGSQQTNDLAYLAGKRFVSASEGERGQRLAESKIKSMTGGDRIVARRLYQDYFEFDPHFKLWLSTNELPSISGSGEAIWRRINVIPFPVTFSAEQQDKGLADRLIQELPGILNWAIQGQAEWRKIGLNPPSGVVQSTGSYREDNDTVGQWIEAACVVEPARRTTMKDLYGSYRRWCDNSSLDAMTNVCFGKELTRRGFEKIRASAGNGRRGIRLRPDFDRTAKPGEQSQAA
jgi:putative DNA primase/helicase